MMFSAKQAATPKGSIVIYDWNGTNWVSRGNPIYGSQACGEDLSNMPNSIRLSKDGNKVIAVYDKSVCSARGPVKVYGWTNNEWSIVGGAINQEYPVNAVDINQDGSKIAIGEPSFGGGSGRIRILSGPSWATVSNFLSHDGADFSFSADGRWLAVYQDGAPGDSWTGISIWDFISSTPSKKGSNFGLEPDYYSDLQISDNGTTVAFMDDQGKINVYRFTSNAWTKIGQNSVGDNDGRYGLNLSGDGNSFVTRPSTNTQFEVYSLITSFWTRIGSNTSTGLTTNPQQSVDINEDGRVVAIGDSNYNSGNGAVNVFYWNNSQWVAKGTTLNGSSGFGLSVSISGDGDHLAVSTAAI